MAQSDPTHLDAGRREGNRRLALILVVVFALMVCLAFAAVPFYRAFCQATGFDGTPRRVETPSGKVLARTVLVHFDTNVRDLPWRFKAALNEQSVHIGATNLAYFTVKNEGATAVTGRAAYSIAPVAAAQYFSKIQCFCFNDQTIPPGVERTFPVVYYVDPKYASDPDTSALQELTLSYTFYPAREDDLSARKGH